ncbi:F0F1 ATP synthase subunit delta [Streptococcus fryi]
MDTKQLTKISKYSRQLVKQAEGQGQLQTFLDEIQAVLTVFEQQSLDNFLSQSLVSDEEKTNVLNVIKEQGSSILSEFIDEVVLKRDYALVYDIFQEILYTSQYTMGQFDMVVKSVVPLNEDQMAAVKRIVKRQLRLGVRSVTEVIDESLLGGFVIEINHKVIDASIKHQIQELKQIMR